MGMSEKINDHMTDEQYASYEAVIKRLDGAITCDLCDQGQLVLQDWLERVEITGMSPGMKGHRYMLTRVCNRCHFIAHYDFTSVERATREDN